MEERGDSAASLFELGHRTLQLPELTRPSLGSHSPVRTIDPAAFIVMIEMPQHRCNHARLSAYSLAFDVGKRWRTGVDIELPIADNVGHAVCGHRGVVTNLLLLHGV